MSNLKTASGTNREIEALTARIKELEKEVGRLNERWRLLEERLIRESMMEAKRLRREALLKRIGIRRER